MKPLKRCNAPACRALIPFDVQYCGQHNHMKRERNKANDQLREREDSKYRRVYHSQRWKDLRKQILQRDDYVCQNCLSNGEYTVADVVHHKIEVKEDITKAYEESNLVSWCHECHNRHHKGN